MTDSYNQTDINLAGGGAGNVQTTFVFQPGGQADANVYTDWQKLIDVAADISGPKIIQVDDTFVSPIVISAGTYDLSQTLLSGGIGVPIPPTLVNLADGVIFENFEAMDGITMTSLSSAPIVSVVPPFLPIKTIVIRNGSVTAGGTAPFVSVSPGSFLTIILDESAGIFAGATPAIDLSAAGAGMSVALDEVGQIDAGIISGPVGSTTVLIIRSPSAIAPVPPGPPDFLGSLITIVSPQAANMAYSSAPADWAGSAPTDLQSAVTRMASAIASGTIGVPIP